MDKMNESIEYFERCIKDNKEFIRDIEEDINNKLHWKKIASKYHLIYESEFDGREIKMTKHEILETIKHKKEQIEEWRFCIDKNNYLMDLENEILEKYGFHFTKLKWKRIMDSEWMNYIKQFMDIGVYETEEQQEQFINNYKKWVINFGGDEWFN